MSLVAEARYPAGQVLRRRNRLFAELGHFAGLKITSEVLNDLVDSVCRVLPSTIPRTLLFQSLFELIGETPDREALFNTAWRLAGNLPLLHAGSPCHPWNSQQGEEIVPVQILEVTLLRQYEDLTYSMVFQFLAGSACPLRSQQYWSPRKLAFLANRKDDSGHGFMFSRRAGSRSKRTAKYPYDDARQLIGMRCLAVIDPDRSQDEPNFQEIKFSSSMASHNRELLKRRSRVDDGYVCPEGFSSAQTCHTCYIGQDKCGAACHAKTYKIASCVRCGQRAYFDPVGAGNCCVNCAAELRKSKKN